MIEGKGLISIEVATIGTRANVRDIHLLETWGDSSHYLGTGIPADQVVIEVIGILMEGSGRADAGFAS